MRLGSGAVLGFILLARARGFSRGPGSDITANKPAKTAAIRNAAKKDRVWLVCEPEFNVGSIWFTGKALLSFA
jgi:hypothetical protein